MKVRAMQRRHVPFPDPVSLAPADVEAEYAFIEETLTDPAAHVYVHCRDWRGRTAATLVAFLSARVSYDEAVALLRRVRPTLRRLPH
jgi:protein-tyrosine phosphatase